MRRTIKPFLKWAGGKRWLTSADVLPDMNKYSRYIEPFLGGGAVFFHLQPAKALLSDVNVELMHLYSVIRDRPTDFRLAMLEHQQLHSYEHYYQMRSGRPSESIARAARFLYLNRTCWNGLYRVNRNGDFNVPIGTKDSVLFADDDFNYVAEVLSRAELLCSDFESVISMAGVGDLLFVDPPYTVRHNLNGFLKYNENMFSWADQIRLSESVRAAACRGASVIVTNANHDSVRELYAGDFEHRELTRVSVLAANSLKRGVTTEAMFVANL
jgi:DNA adenine methylase